MNRAPKKLDRFFSVREIASDPEGAAEYIKELRDSRNAWHARFNRCERDFKLFKRSQLGDGKTPQK
jgi:hypothetical protein